MANDPPEKSSGGQADFRVEHLFLRRQKFYHFRVWYRAALARYVQGMLPDSRTLFRRYLERTGSRHGEGPRN